ncbi:MAG: hypothetical protein PHE78_07290 [Candidatus Gastranaerophilales bacterium]|nr:hypothetical protein [Candidatus Gastranaerophilales bacterium]
MEEKDIEKLIKASENIDSILLLSKMAESSIEYGSIEKVWDMHILLSVIKKLCTESLVDLRALQEKV